MSPLPVELFSRQLRRVFICAMLRAVCLALLALRRRATHIDITKRCFQNRIKVTRMPPVGLPKVWTGRQEPIFTSRFERRNLAESNKVHPVYVGLASQGSAQLPSRPLPELRYLGTYCRAPRSARLQLDNFQCQP